MEQNKRPEQFQNNQEWEAAIKDRFEGLHRKLSELIGEARVLQAKCDRYEAALKEIRGDGQKFIPAKHDILLIVNEALSGEGEKPAKEIEYMPVPEWVEWLTDRSPHIPDLSELDQKEKQLLTDTLFQSSGLQFLKLFYAIGLNSHMESRIVEEESSDLFRLRFELIQKGDKQKEANL